MHKPGWRAFQWVLGIAIIAFAVREVARGWSQLESQPVEWRLRGTLLVASVLVVWTMYALLIQAWRVMLAGWGERLDFLAGARIWAVSSLGKYIPGKVWAIAGMAMMAQRAGVAPWAATSSAVILQALAIGSGAAVVGATGVTMLEARYPWVRTALLILGALSVAGMTLLLWPPFIRRLLALMRIEPPTAAAPGIGPVALGALTNIVAWCGYGLGLWLLANGLFPAPGLTVPRAIAAFTASYVAGLLFLPAPGGFGVREGVFVLMLDGVIGTGPAVALAAASRLLLTFTEFGAAAPFLRSFFRERNVAES